MDKNLEDQRQSHGELEKEEDREKAVIKNAAEEVGEERKEAKLKEMCMNWKKW